MLLYNFKSLLNVKYSEELFTKDYSDKSINLWVNNFVKTNKPDFIALLKIGVLKPLAFSFNYNLKSTSSDTVKMEDVINSVPTEQLTKIYEADRICLKFIKSNNFIKTFPLFQLRFSSNLDHNEQRTLLRNIHFIPSPDSNKLFPVILVSFQDITELHGVFKCPKVNIRYPKEDIEVSHEFQKLIEDTNFILSNLNNLTFREQEILNLIGMGKTSKEISNLLHITKNTVNTHRQNLIKKFNVSNTTALIKLIL